MAIRSDGIKCKKCGSRMNHHAEKLVDPSTAEEMSHMDYVLGGVVEEFYACANCGFAMCLRASGSVAL